MSTAQRPIIIKEWAKGVAQTPHGKGIPLMRNADIESFPGAVKVAKLPTAMFFQGVGQTFTADASTDICTAPAAVESNGASFSGLAVTFTTTGTLPAGLSLATTYFLIYQSATTFKVATSYKNAVGSAAPTAIDITNAGTGVHTIVPVPIGTLNSIVKDQRTNAYWFQDSNGRIWFSVGQTYAYLYTGNTLTNAAGNGLALFLSSDGLHTYLFAFRNQSIDVSDVYGTSNIETPVWSNAWQSMNSGASSGNTHEARIGQDNIIYFTDDRYVGSILEKAGSIFDPANAATYTYNNQALKLPQGEIAKCLEEIGINLLTGGSIFNKIYPWDRVSASFAFPILVPEYGVYKMKNLGNLVYILAGNMGNIYTTQGTYARWFARIPPYLFNNGYSIVQTPLTWGGIGATNNAIVFGVSGTTSGSSGVYKLYTDKRIVQDNTPSIGSVAVPGLWATNDFYLMGYAGGADQFNSPYSQYTSYQTVLHSPLLKIGTKTSKATVSQVELQMATPASSGHVRVRYRKNDSGSFSDFATAATATANGSDMSFNFDVGLIDIENLQIQIEMDGAFELVEARLYP